MSDTIHAHEAGNPAGGLQLCARCNAVLVDHSAAYGTADYVAMFYKVGSHAISDGERTMLVPGGVEVAGCEVVE
jgi:hypothetical protein